MNTVNLQSLQKWRRSQREELLDRRMRVEPPQRKAWDTAIAAQLRRVLDDAGARVVSLYWPFKGEFNSRSLMSQLVADGIRVALPVVVEARAPLEFRPWHPDAPMTRGVYGIPIPQDAAPVTPEAIVAPLVGFDHDGYRLGYGGGYYDRTLAALQPRPFTVGVGYELSRLDTIRPAAHDCAMDCIVTEIGLHERGCGAAGQSNQYSTRDTRMTTKCESRNRA